MVSSRYYTALIHKLNKSWEKGEISIVLFELMHSTRGILLNSLVVRRVFGRDIFDTFFDNSGERIELSPFSDEPEPTPGESFIRFCFPRLASTNFD